MKDAKATAIHSVKDASCHLVCVCTCMCECVYVCGTGDVLNHRIYILVSLSLYRFVETMLRHARSTLVVRRSGSNISVVSSWQPWNSPLYPTYSTATPHNVHAFTPEHTEFNHFTPRPCVCLESSYQEPHMHCIVLKFSMTNVEHNVCGGTEIQWIQI